MPEEENQAPGAEPPTPEVASPPAPGLEGGPVDGAPSPTPPPPPSAPRRRTISPHARAIFGAFAGIGLVLLAVSPLARLEREPRSNVGTSTHAADPLAPPAPSAQTGDAAEQVLVLGAVPATADAETPESTAAPAAPPERVWRVASYAGDPAVVLTQGTVGKRTFLACLAGAGLAKGEVTRLLKAFDGVRKFTQLGAKDSFSVAKDKATGRLLAFEYAVSPLDVWQAREAPDPSALAAASDAGAADPDAAPPEAQLAAVDARAGPASGAEPMARVHELEAKRLDFHVTHKRIAVAVTVAEDLRAALTRAGLGEDVLELLDDALDGHTELADVRPGARLRIVAAADLADGAYAHTAELEAVEYTPAVAGAAATRVYHFGSGSRKAPIGYYDAKGRQPLHGGWRIPVPLARLSSRFNPHRVHPVLKVVMPHNGVDFAAPPGTPVYSSAAGTVRSVGDGGPCGNMVQVQHLGGLVTAYCHLARFAGGLHVGQHVEARQLVGYVGQTGRATGPHLHFAVKRGEIFLDPLALKLDGFRVLPSADRDAFAERRTELDSAMDAIPLPPPLPAAPAAGAPGSPVASGGTGVEEVIFDEP
jgi:murein DD-endopeptidase MepM/ murein hydrolase activator NlpD